MFFFLSFITLTLSEDPAVAANLKAEELFNPMKFKIATSLPDANQDGYADNQDFQSALKNISMSRFEISQVF